MKRLCKTLSLLLALVLLLSACQTDPAPTGTSTVTRETETAVETEPTRTEPASTASATGESTEPVTTAGEEPDPKSDLGGYAVDGLFDAVCGDEGFENLVVQFDSIFHEAWFWYTKIIRKA